MTMKLNELKFHEKDRPVRDFFYSQYFYLKNIWREQKSIFLFLTILSIITSIMLPLEILLQKRLIDQLTVVQKIPNELGFVLVLLVAITFLSLFGQLSGKIQDYLFRKISLRVNYLFKAMLNKKVTSVSLENFESSFFYNQVNLAAKALEGNGLGTTYSFLQIITSVFSLFSVFSILMAIHWTLPLTVLLSTIPGVVIVFFSKLKNYKVEKNVVFKERELSYTESLFFDKSYLKEIKVYTLSDYLLEKWKKLYFYTMNKRLEVTKWELKNSAVMILFVGVINTGVSVFFVYQLVENALTIGSYVALTAAIITLQGIFAQIGAHIASIFEAAIYNNALIKLLKIEHFDDEKREEINSIETIDIKNGTFNYPYSDISVFSKLNFSIRRGEKISIVGGNGSGKTTLAHCLVGLFNLTEGTILVNGENMTDIDKSSLHKQVAVVFQTFPKYMYSLRENIGFGNVDDMENDQKIWDVIRKVGLGHKLSIHNVDLDTYLSKEMDGGIDLSGGEWQKIALGRALMKDVSLILLDEPTASLDPHSELKTLELFDSMTDDKTTITITHRIGPTKLSDKIIVMDKGKIEEIGTFDELINNKGLFYRMHQAQSKWYERKEHFHETVETT